MIFDWTKLKHSVSKNWQLFSNFNTRQFWSQKQLKTNWAHFFEHKERPQCANIWQSLPWSTVIQMIQIQMIESFTKIRTSSKTIRIYLVGNAIKIPLKWGVNQLSRVNGIRKLRPFKCCKMGPISNTGSVPKTVTWYWHFVCTEPNFSTWRDILQKSAFTSWYLTVRPISWNLVYQRIDNFFKFQHTSILESKIAKNQLGTLFEHKEHPQCANIWQSLTMKGFTY